MLCDAFFGAGGFQFCSLLAQRPTLTRRLLGVSLSCCQLPRHQAAATIVLATGLLRLSKAATLVEGDWAFAVNLALGLWPVAWHAALVGIKKHNRLLGVCAEQRPQAWAGAWRQCSST